MLSRLKQLLSTARHRGGQLRAYAALALANPQLTRRAVGSVRRTRSRAAESAARAASDPGLIAAVPRTLVPLDDLIARLGERMGVVVLDRRPDTAAIGVADVDFLSALAFLATRLPDCEVRCDGQPIRLGAPGFRVAAQRAKVVLLETVDETLSPLSVSLEQYQFDGTRWVSRNDFNGDLRAIYADLLETPGVVQAETLLGAPTTAMVARGRPVDVVFTWVNHADPGWLALHAEHRPGSAAPAEVSSDASAMTRFTNNDELRFALRAIAQNMPWVNRVHVFTNCARPDWLRRRPANLSWVQHSDVMAPEHLPVFNSHVIESYLHRIPGLAEQFIYFNDDFLVMRKLRPTHFFDEGGRSISMLEPYGMVSGEVRAGDPDYLNAARNGAALIRERYGVASTRLHRHVPYALRRSVLEALETEFRPAVDAFRSNKFRRINDLNIPSFLYHHYAFLQGQSRHGICRSVLVKSNDIHWQERLATAAKRQDDVVCINEGGEMEPSSKWRESIAEFMRRQFPTRSPWER